VKNTLLWIAKSAERKSARKQLTLTSPSASQEQIRKFMNKRKMYSINDFAAFTSLHCS